VRFYAVAVHQHVIFGQTGNYYQPAPPQKLESAFADAALGEVYGFPNDAQALLRIEHFFFLFHDCCCLVQILKCAANVKWFIF
jgi:hypothetical protein